ncbi:YeeE/YedE family protein [Robertkochia flava]|uniref:YeeE/YedE family protein n=1 Tax=Robertkochia flava TaxID=3447986 RepID=UPI001CCC3990|nr:YeeE/YedE thiosulfate transporter family protein [Robertkochia marina]
MEWIYEPWPWYVSGPMIAVIMLLLLMAGKNFGMSANLRTFCTIAGAGKTNDFFRFDWKSQRWNLLLVAGAVMGGFLANTVLSRDTKVNINEDVVVELQNMGFESAGDAYLPTEIFSNDVFGQPITLGLLLLGGFLVGFGARYAGGCTSGHAISGMSDLQLPSLIAVIGFFAGGLIMINLLFPLIF